MHFTWVQGFWGMDSGGPGARLLTNKSKKRSLSRLCWVHSFGSLGEETTRNLQVWEFLIVPNLRVTHWVKIYTAEFDFTSISVCIITYSWEKLVLRHIKSAKLRIPKYYRRSGPENFTNSNLEGLQLPNVDYFSNPQGMRNPPEFGRQMWPYKKRNEFYSWFDK